MIKIKEFDAWRQGGRPAALCGGALAAAALAAGCAGGQHAARSAAPRPAAPATEPVSPASLVKVSRPDDAGPAPVAAAFYVAWAGVDAVHDGPDAFAARCAPLVTPALERELAASRPAAAAWRWMRASRTVSLVQVHAVTRPDGAPSRHRLRRLPERLRHQGHRDHGRRATGSDGITLRLARAGARWLVSAVLFV